MPKAYNQTYKLLKYTKTSTDEQGNPVVETETSCLNEARAEKAIERASKAGKPVEIARAKTFVFYEAESDKDFETLITEIADLVPSVAEARDIFNRGYTLKQNTIVQDHMDDPDWSEGEADGAFDLRAEAAVVRERTKANPEEKAMRDLLKLTPEALARVLANFQAAGQAAD